MAIQSLIEADKDFLIMMTLNTVRFFNLESNMFSFTGEKIYDAIHYKICTGQNIYQKNASLAKILILLLGGE